jgi:hypothetical protein
VVTAYGNDGDALAYLAYAFITAGRSPPGHSLAHPLGS